MVTFFFFFAGMNVLHTHKPIVVHRDLKSGNVLLTRENSEQRLVAKIADFGLSKSLAYTDKLSKRKRKGRREEKRREGNDKRRREERSGREGKKRGEKRKRRGERGRGRREENGGRGRRRRYRRRGRGAGTIRDNKAEEK